MLSVSYAGINEYGAGKTSGVLRGGVSDANRCYVLAHCGGGLTNVWMGRTGLGGGNNTLKGGPIPQYWTAMVKVTALKLCSYALGL